MNFNALINAYSHEEQRKHWEYMKVCFTINFLRYVVTMNVEGT